jgi:hypothetical protein
MPYLLNLLNLPIASKPGDAALKPWTDGDFIDSNQSNKYLSLFHYIFTHIFAA